MAERIYTPRRYLFEGLDRGFRSDDRAIVTEIVDGARGERMTFPWRAKSYAHLLPGYVYSIEAAKTESGGLSIRFGTATDGKPFEDDEERQAIRLRHDAALLSQRADKAAERVASADRALPDLLRPIAKHYAGLTTAQQKVAFEVALITALRKGR